jgi:8-oxo-dGTP diphosphatase
MARASVVAAGGIVLRRQQPPLIAVVRVRKRDEWVLPKGKLDQGETPRAAARREVLEETGHDVTVHEFLGTLAYEIGGRSKIVHYWRMEAAPEQAHELMNDVRAVDWLPLEAAVSRLSRPSEQAFLEHVGPQALAAFARRPKAKAPAARKRRGQPAAIAAPPLAEPVSEAPPSQSVPAQSVPAPRPQSPPEPVVLVESPVIADDAIVAEAMPAFPAPPEIAAAQLEPPARPAMSVGPDDAGQGASLASEQQCRSFAQKVRDWLGRAA